MLTTYYCTLVGYYPESETSYQSDESVDVIDSPEQSSDRIVATKLPEVEALQTNDNKQSREQSVEQPARVSNLELENKLLRKEVESLNGELLSLAQRSKESQESKDRFFFTK
jgi:hypothetical protein